ncbi:decarboxylating NADP(+)-dependent phosphogluconate dehydrogenase [Luteolibacter yonseiensis]|jgi:6-phosphogluconate dehydrogenase|uniref:6-phosphogluconate dehydrogenase, decarboxylating n=1 Tax=Luteolibacter yonseiensis TaxID=1144680 RepID=A0A934V9Z6_9BACT|nr:decarboxylating NADP(+)-dependent phosphogluconate dehydrogenase [Luteolibacter yonseiensis]MBK1815678.1 decarboxylating NADP(+)-dependent phosphogluconate dehydrogenase [Luteolibacter yonseiensis]
MSNSDFGLIGLAVMGQNLVLNVESRGFQVSVYNRTASVTDEFTAKHPDKKIVGEHTLEGFVKSLASPRKVMIMVKAGGPVDAVIESLIPLLDKGDIIIDGGNSLYTDTERRDKWLGDLGFRFIGAGVSGGEEGARKGPSIMPGGPASTWEVMKPIFESIAAVAEGEPCVFHIGPGGAGHYVKMIHNGIEYGDMQLICEAYNIFKAAGFTPEELAEVFTEWNEGDLESYLIQITSKIFAQKDPETGKPLVDLILDTAGQKGTGKWTLINAVENAVVISTINAAVEARILSSMKDKRVEASKVLEGPKAEIDIKKKKLVKKVHDALFASKIISYAQGLDLIAAMGKEKDWGLDLGKIAAIWRGGCIIRARFLNDITDAYRTNPQLENLMLAPFFTDLLNEFQENWREVISLATLAGIPVPAFSASLGYYDSYRSAVLPANLLQAQRDFFGAHTYERTDKPRGEFSHTDWPEVIG